jgi:sigma-B regulation protein RsbU (phosphoserine phosphatase)
LCEALADGMFVTLVLGVLDTETGDLVLSSAGHPLPLLRRTSGEVEDLDSPRSLPLGIDEDTEYASESYPLAPGETVSLFTDGIDEATNAELEEFGAERLRDAIRDSDGTPCGTLGSILEAVKGFRGTAAPSDDITLVCFGPVDSE